MLHHMYGTAALSTSEVRQAEEMVFHQPDVRDHHVEDVFTHRLDVAVQLQLLAVQQHHANLPLHILRFTTFLAQRAKEKGVEQGIESRLDRKQEHRSDTNGTMTLSLHSYHY